MGKSRRTGVLLADFREFWRTKADGLNGYDIFVRMNSQNTYDGYGTGKLERLVVSATSTGHEA
jgi:hypothetical protein